MDKTNFDAEINSLRSNHRIFKSLLKWMICSNVILVLGLLYSLNREKVILVPQVAPEYKIWVKKAQVSPEYLNVLSRNLLDLLLNVTPNSVLAQQKELIENVSPQYREELNAKLTEIAKQITQNNLSQNFYITSIRVASSTNVVFVRGTLNQYLEKNLSNSSFQTYKLTFSVHNYMVSLTNVEQLPENDPQLREYNND